MQIGLPRALLYYRYGTLWESFFKALGCKVVLSSETNQQTLAHGISHCISECCLPIKIYLGHVKELIGRCDYILVPRFEQIARNEEFCMRLWGLPDIVRSTFPGTPILDYDLKGNNEFSEFISMGKRLGKGRIETGRAYRHAVMEQNRADEQAIERQRRCLNKAGLKLLMVAQPYIIHDPYVGEPLVRMIKEQGAELIFADRFEREVCREQSKQLTRDLFWTMNKECVGAIPLTKGRVDGIILLTAFPCGTDSLVNDLVLRRTKHVPIINIVLDEQQGFAGLQTRIECFLDILKERRRSDAS